MSSKQCYSNKKQEIQFQFLCILFISHNSLSPHTHTHTHLHIHPVTQPVSILKGQELFKGPVKRLHIFGPRIRGRGGLCQQKVSWESQLCQLGCFSDTRCHLPFRDAFFTKSFLTRVKFLLQV